MFGSAILDIAIGVVFIYLMLSLVVTAANELLTAILKARGLTLWKGICNLLPTGDPQSPDSIAKKDFAQAVYDHPLVDGLSFTARPSYIPSRIFALALLDVIVEDPNGKIEMDALRTKISALPDALKKPLNLLLHESGEDLEAFKTHLEIWFNHAMDRVSGWYKRRVQFVIFGIAGLLTVVMNVDSILLINRLSRDSSLRATLVAKASALKDSSAKPSGPGSDEIAARETELENSLSQLRGLNLPIGWTTPAQKADHSVAADAIDSHDPERLFPDGLRGSPNSLGAVIFRHGIGWLLTAFAISLGAPFWFDVLNRFVNIRSSGKAPEEKPKKPKEVPRPATPGDTAG